MYIAIEGTKGTGKSTLLENLEHKLQQEGIDFQMFAPTKAMPKDIRHITLCCSTKIN